MRPRTYLRVHPAPTTHTRAGISSATDVSDAVATTAKLQLQRAEAGDDPEKRRRASLEALASLFHSLEAGADSFGSQAVRGG